MYVLVTYDVSTMTKAGKTRLRKVAKICENYGQRVQNSVFECKIEPEQWVQLKHALLQVSDLAEDSIRFYHLGKHWQNRVEHHGKQTSFNIEGPLII